MSFRNRLTLFLVTTLIVVQSLTALYVYSYLRRDAIEKGKRELSTAMAVFERQLNFLATRVADDVEVLSLDYALRSAIALSDHDTELTALRNHGDRIGAARMMMVALTGQVAADTGAPESSGGRFPFPSLLRKAASAGKATALARLDSRLCWVVVVPVRAPVPIAFIAACIPVDSALLDRLRAITAELETISLTTTEARGHWHIEAESGRRLSAAAMRITPSKLSTPHIVEDASGGEYLAKAMALSSASDAHPVYAMMAYPLTKAFSVYQGLISHLLWVFAAALLAALLGSMVIARGLSRPLEMLAVTAKRIAAGDYHIAEGKKSGSSEIGHLTRAFRTMAKSIAEREQALTGALQTAEIARAEANSANEAKSHFLANMSHELRTPLNAILGFSEMLEGEYLGPLGMPQYRNYARDIRASGQQLLGQVERILEISAMESDTLVMEHSAVDLKALLERCMASFAAMAAREKIAIRFAATPAAWPAIEGDGARLSQAFGNVLHNAVKFSHPSGTVTLTVENVQDRVITRICDDGAGMDHAQTLIAVKPFQRLRSALDGRHQGAGLGLSFAKNVIERHGGTLAIESVPGKGTVVSIVLPVKVGGARKAA